MNCRAIIRFRLSAFLCALLILTRAAQGLFTAPLRGNPPPDVARVARGGKSADPLSIRGSAALGRPATSRQLCSTIWQRVPKTYEFLMILAQTLSQTHV